MDSMVWHILFGRFVWIDLPVVKAWQDPTISNIIAGAAAMIAVFGALAGLGLITWLRKWRYLWSEWFTSLDHKRIGIMYVCLAVVMIVRGVIEGVLMRVQQDLAVNAPGILAPDHFAQFFSTHGTIMIFLSLIHI